MVTKLDYCPSVSTKELSQDLRERVCVCVCGIIICNSVHV